MTKYLLYAIIVVLIGFAASWFSRDWGLDSSEDRHSRAKTISPIIQISIYYSKVDIFPFFMKTHYKYSDGYEDKFMGFVFFNDFTQ
jgi:hypothetical protein